MNVVGRMTYLTRIGNDISSILYGSLQEGAKDNCSARTNWQCVFNANVARASIAITHRFRLIVNVCDDANQSRKYTTSHLYFTFPGIIQSLSRTSQTESSITRLYLAEVYPVKGIWKSWSMDYRLPRLLQKSWWTLFLHTDLLWQIFWLDINRTKYLSHRS